MILNCNFNVKKVLIVIGIYELFFVLGNWRFEYLVWVLVKNIFGGFGVVFECMIILCFILGGKYINNK